MKVLEEAVRTMLDDLLERARRAETLDGRLEAATGPCAGIDRSRHIELVRELVERAKRPRSHAIPRGETPCP